MTLTKKDLNKTLESMRVLISDEKRAAILERFGTEPEPYEWTEEDIHIQIRNFIECGEFVKTSQPGGGSSTIPPGHDF